jgi:hypothetical protein
VERGADRELIGGAMNSRKCPRIHADAAGESTSELRTAMRSPGRSVACTGNTSYLELPANLTEGVDELTVASWI